MGQGIWIQSVQESVKSSWDFNNDLLTLKLLKIYKTVFTFYMSSNHTHTCTHSTHLCIYMAIHTGTEITSHKEHVDSTVFRTHRDLRDSWPPNSISFLILLKFIFRQFIRICRHEFSYSWSTDMLITLAPLLNWSPLTLTRPHFSLIWGFQSDSLETITFLSKFI